MVKAIAGVLMLILMSGCAAPTRREGTIVIADTFRAGCGTE